MPLCLGHTLTTKDALVAVTFSFAVASVSYAVIEQPFRRNQRLVTQPRRGLLLGAGLIGASVISAVLVMVLVVIPTGSGVSTTATTSAARNVLAATSLRLLPANLSPPLASAHEDYTPNCYDTAYELSPLPQNTCVLGDVKSKKTVVLFGDSHANMWRAPIAAIAAQRGWKLVTYVHLGAAFVDSTDLDIVGPTGDYAASWNKIVFRRLSILRPALVIMTGYTTDYLGPRTMAEMLTKLKKDGSQVIWIEDTPFLGFDVPDCLAAHVTNIQKCSVSLKSGLTLPKTRSALNQTAARDGAFIVDPLSWFCTSTLCPPVIANTVVYADQDHVTRTYALKLTPELSAALAPAMPNLRHRRN